MLPKPSFPPPKSSFTASHSDLTSMTAAVSAQKQLRFSLHKREVAKLGVKLGLRSTRAASHGPFSRGESQTQVPGTGSEAGGNRSQCKQSISSVTAPPDSTLATAPVPTNPPTLPGASLLACPQQWCCPRPQLRTLCGWPTLRGPVSGSCLPSSSCPPLVEGGNPAMFLPEPTYSGCGES